MIKQKIRMHYSLAGLLLFSQINMSAMFHNYMFDAKKALYVGGLFLAAGLGSLGMYVWQNTKTKELNEEIKNEKTLLKMNNDVLQAQEQRINSLQEKLATAGRLIDTLIEEKLKIFGEKLEVETNLREARKRLALYRTAIKTGELTVNQTSKCGSINILKALGEEL